MAASNNLTLLINRQDTNGVNVVNRTVGAVSFAGNKFEKEQKTLAADTNIHAFDLPCALVLQVYFKNTHASANILLTMTMQGGAAVAAARVPPGGVYTYWAPVTGSTVGFTAISYTSDVASATCEFAFGGA